jgi:hypothetical protein
MLRTVRSVGLLLVALVAVAIGVRQLDRGESHSHHPAHIPSRQEQAERALTLLDVWAQSVVPGILSEHSEARALRAGSLFAAARFEQRVRLVLTQAANFEPQVAHDALLHTLGSDDVRALHPVAAAWRAWAAALLRAQTRAPDRRARLVISKLEANAVRLHQAAYAAVDSSLRAAVTSPG